MSLENLQSINWDTVELETVNPYMQRRIVTGERMTVARIYLKDGFLVPMHSHVHEQITQVISGRMRFTFGDDRSEVAEYGPGDVIVIPSNLPHEAQKQKNQRKVIFSFQIIKSIEQNIGSKKNTSSILII